MNIGDWIQTGLLALTALSLVTLAWQGLLQHRLLKAQLLRDRFEMYWETYEPVSKEHIDELKVYPEGYMDLSLYRSRYEGNDDAIHRYIYMSLLYEYLAFTFTLHHVLKVPDPLGSDWTRRWATELLASREFNDVHAEYRDCYPRFEAFIEALRAGA